MAFNTKPTDLHHLITSKDKNIMSSHAQFLIKMSSRELLVIPLIIHETFIEMHYNMTIQIEVGLLFSKSKQHTTQLASDATDMTKTPEICHAGRWSLL
jgi:hypothetical protein